MLKASWIHPSYNMGKVCHLFRKDFCIDKEVSSATLSVTARGVYEANLNNQRVGDFVMAPSFEKIHFAPVPMTALIVSGLKLIQLMARYPHDGGTKTAGYIMK